MKIIIAVASIVFISQAARIIYGDKTQNLSALVLMSSIGFWHFIFNEPIILQNAIIANIAIMAMWLSQKQGSIYFYLVGFFLIGVSCSLSGAVGLLIPLMTFIYFVAAQNNLRTLLNVYCIPGAALIFIGYQICGGGDTDWQTIIYALDTENSSFNALIDITRDVIYTCCPFIILLPLALRKILSDKNTTQDMSFLMIWFLTGPAILCILGVYMPFVIVISLFPFCIFMANYLSTVKIFTK